MEQSAIIGPAISGDTLSHPVAVEEQALSENFLRQIERFIDQGALPEPRDRFTWAGSLAQWPNVGRAQVRDALWQRGEQAAELQAFDEANRMPQRTRWIASPHD